MPTTSTVGMDWMLVQTSSGSDLFYPRTPWMNAGDVGKIRGTIELLWHTGNAEVSLAYQTANNETSQDGAASVGSYVAMDGVAYPGGFTDISGNTLAKQMVRLGWNVKLSSGSTQAYAFVGGSVDIQDCS